MIKIRRAETVYPVGRLVAALLVFGFLSCTIPASDAGEPKIQPLFNVGYKVIDLKYRKDGQDQILTVAVWNPAAVQPRAHNYGGPTKGNVAVDAAPLAGSGPYPLLVFSHGYGGGGIGSVFFTEALAARGQVASQ